MLFKASISITLGSDDLTADRTADRKVAAVMFQTGDV